MNTIANKPSAASSPAPGAILGSKCACGNKPFIGGECGNCRKQAPGILQRRAAGPAPAEIPPSVYTVLRAPGRPLADDLRREMEPRFGCDFSNVRVHTDSAAADSAHAVNAIAYTVGRNVAFAAGRYDPGTIRGRRLLAHELAHVVQQGASASLPQRLALQAATSPLEAAADRAASAAVREVPVHMDGSATQPVIARQEKPADGGLSAPSPGTAARRVGELLNKPDPIAGVGDPKAAMDVLRSLGRQELVDTLVDLDGQMLLDTLLSFMGTSDSSEVGAAVYAVRFTSTQRSNENQFGILAAKGLAQLPEDVQDDIIARVLERRGGNVKVADIREGLSAMLESEAYLDAQGTEEVDEGASPLPPLLAGIAMGGWDPGKMPVPFYIGNAAHVAIAARYAAHHRADAAFYNFSPISAILEAAKNLGIAVNPMALKAAQMGLKPDIANLSRRHLYEIKPTRLESLGAAEANLYIAAFLAAGIPMAPGPSGENGTTGTLPAPGGWFEFRVARPGVIVYDYRQPKRRRVRSPKSVQVEVRAPDPTFVKKMEALTGLTGTALIIYIIISEGTRIVIPPRNLIPVP